MKVFSGFSNSRYGAKITTLWKLIRQTLNETGKDNVLKQSAALSYYTIFSLPPLLIIVIKLTSVFYGQAAIEGKVFGQISGLVGAESALQIQSALQKIHTSGDSFVATVIGVITLLIGSTAVFSEIQDTINSIWDIRAKPKRGWVKMIVNRLLSFSLIVTMGFLLIVTLFVNTLIEALSSQLTKLMPEFSIYTFSVLNLMLMFVVLTSLFAIIFKVLPDAKIRWRDVLTGSIVTAVMFMLGKSILGWYLSTNASVSYYGTAGSIILILLWVYYSSAILFIGAEFTQVYASQFGRKIQPTQYAVFIDLQEIETKTKPKVPLP